MADRVVLAAALERGGGGGGVIGAPSLGQPAAAALNLVGGGALFGRNWGCRPPGDQFAGLHFELCYYQARWRACWRS
jgi:predicted N-acyltransferase